MKSKRAPSDDRRSPGDSCHRDFDPPLWERDDELKRTARALALLRQSIDDRIRYWAEWNDGERQLDLFRPPVDHKTD
jgi:hypothetical protein